MNTHGFVTLDCHSNLLNQFTMQNCDIDIFTWNYSWKYGKKIKSHVETHLVKAYLSNELSSC